MSVSKWTAGLASAWGMGLAGKAWAHPGHAADGLLAGWLHPFTGVDHWLAMATVGLLAAGQQGGWRWALPGAFLAGMAAAPLLAGAGLAPPATETGIALSLLTLGCLAAWGRWQQPLKSAQPAALLPVLAGFGAFHGAAHWMERAAAEAGDYAAGFLLATALLHAAGFFGKQLVAKRSWSAPLERWLGAGVAGFGLALLS